jgi:N5-(carboxyethyl)ornithine synthase
MRTIGFVASEKENERRRAVLPQDLSRVRNCGSLVFERGYGLPLGVPDAAYEEAGSVVAELGTVYECDIICNPKAPEPRERERFREGQTLFGWIHAVQGRAIVDFLIDREMTAIAWEDMFDQGRHCFWRNNEIAGEAAVLHAMSYLGRLPTGLKAALIGTGNCARGALAQMSRCGIEVRTYDRRSVGELPRELPGFDLVVNAVLWDVFRTDHMIAREHLRRMRPGAMIIDISCDEGMGIESTKATTIANPVYECDGVLHYAVDHTPALFYQTASASISDVVVRYLDQLVEERPDACLRAATIIEHGRILDDRIQRYQKRYQRRVATPAKSGREHRRVPPESRPVL